MDKVKPIKKRNDKNERLIKALKVIHETEMKEGRHMAYIAVAATAVVFFLIGLMF